MIYLASVPRCGSTYLFRSLAGLPQGPDAPEELLREAGVVKTHLPPWADSRIPTRPDEAEDDRVIFMFGDPFRAVLSTIEHRHDPVHFRNCGVTEYDPDVDLLECDVLGYEEIFRGWWDMSPVPTLCVRYETLWHSKNRRAVERWIGREIRWLPWKTRKTSKVPLRLRGRLRDVYGELRRRVDAAPSTCVRFWGVRWAT